MELEMKIGNLFIRNDFNSISPFPFHEIQYLKKGIALSIRIEKLQILKYLLILLQIFGIACVLFWNQALSSLTELNLSLHGEELTQR